MSRTRLIRPEFFADELLASVPVSVRYFYIGLWTLCDDAGYFELKPRQIAAALYPYDGQAKRQRVTDVALSALEGIGRVKSLECGLHGHVPTLPKHGTKGGNKSDTYRSRHLTTCLSVQVRPSTDKSSSVLVLDSVLDSVSENARAREDGKTTRGLRDVSRDVGGFVGNLAGRRPA